MKKINKYLRVFFWITLVVGVFVISGFINHSLQDEICKQVIIDIEDATSYGFIDEGDITEILNRNFNTPISQKVKDINTFEIENALNDHQAVDESQVYISIDGRLIIKLRQRKPILRVFAGKTSFYIDHKGRVMPVSKKYTAHVPIANGSLKLDYASLLIQTNTDPSEMDSTLIPQIYFDLFNFANYLDSDPFWKAQIEQLYVDKDSEFELIPRVGNHTIVFGDVYNLESKFEKLKIFYLEGLSKTGWNEYKTINLKFNDQVVCTKRY